MLKVENLSANLNGKVLLEDINIQVESSKLNIILGPNGAGKSTFLKSLAKIIDSKGKIYLDNKDISNSSIELVSKKAAYMGQFNEGTNLRVIDVLELSRRKYSGIFLNKRDHEIIEQNIKEFGLKPFLYRDIDSLSGGERQKIFLAASLIQKPRVLLLDEPISHLDPKNQIEILQIIKEKTVKNDLIVFVVLHDLQNALHYGDNIMMIKNSRLLHFKESSFIDEQMINDLYGVDCELFWQNGHPFTFFRHTHSKHPKGTHTHKGES